MSKLELISKEKHFNKHWHKPSNYKFTEHESFCPIALREVPSAIMSLPICFLKQDEDFQLGVLLGLKPNSNLALDDNGEWLFEYIPAFYRNYPFSLATTEDNKLSLCINSDNHSMQTNSTQEEFFTKEGAPTETISAILNELSGITASLKRTTAACDILSKLGLIEPWPISIVDKDKTKNVEGVYRVSEASFDKTSIEQLNDLRESDALLLIYGQLFSMQNLHRLGQQLVHHNANMREVPAELDLDGASVLDSGNISFSNL